MKRILLFADGFRIPTNQRKRSGDISIGWNSIFTGKAFSYMLLFVLLLFSTKNYGQCSTYPSGTSQNGSAYTFCIDNSNTISVANLRNGQYVVLNVVRGFTYTFRIGNVFTTGLTAENLTLFDASNDSYIVGDSNSGGVTISNWVSPISGQIKVLLSRGSCVTTDASGGTLTIDLNSVGNNIDSQTAFGTNTWRGHIYNWTGGAPPGGTPSPPTPPSTNPFTASQYAGYYDVGTETIATNFNFGGDTACFNVFSNGTQRASIYTQLFAVRYRMKSTRPAGCYIVNVQGDDGVRLYVDNVLVFDEWQEQPTQNFQSILVYLDGDADLILDYYENGGGNVVSFSITPFVASSNSIVAPTPSTVCSGVTPGVINGSSYTYNGAAINPTIRYQWQTATNATGPWSNVTTGTSGTAEDYTPAAITTTGANIRYYKRVVSATAAYASACTWDSNVISITTGANTAPGTPTTTAGTNVSCSSFTANWNTVTTATSYKLDVSTSSTFGSFVSVYNNLDVGLVTSFNVTGLALGTTYYYRVRSFNGCSGSTSANTALGYQTVTTQNPSASISGTATVCQNAASPNITFGNTGPSAITVTYRINSGANQTINVGANTTANVAAPTTTSGTFAYSLVSVAYQSAPTCSTTITGAATITVNPLPALAGNISGTATVCQGQSGVSYSVPAIANATNYTWSYSGIGFTPSGTTASITGSFSSSATSGDLTVTGVNACGNGTVSATYAITVNPLPSAPTVGTITNVTCSSAGSVVLSGLPSGSWTINQSNGTTNTTYSGSGTSYTVTGLAVGSYTFSVNNGTCTSASTPNVPIIDASSATWDGSGWVGGIAPDATKNIIIASSSGSPFAANLSGCSLTINTGVTATVPSGVTLTITNAVTTNGQLIFQNNASLVQTTNATNVGAIEYRRISSLMKNFDYTYWSSPVWGDGTVVPKQTAKNLSPNTLADKYFRFSGSANDWVFDDSEMIPGVGFIIRTPKEGNPWPNGEIVSFPYAQPVAFRGIPNNGNYLFSAGAGEFNLIGNPYPSAIDADTFINANSGIIYGALYFWTHNTAIAPSGSDYVYTADDYATYNITGGTGTIGTGGNFVDANNNGIMDPGEEVDSNRPLGKIAAGQSFFVESQLTPSVTQFVFNNSMRVAGNNSQFFKQANTKKTAAVEKNRVWLNLTNSKGAFKQLLVGYITGATNDWDNLYDGPSFDGQEFVDFYSTNQGKNLTIQGRALPFETTDVVPLGYRSTIAGAFDISIDKRDGALAGQEIWLEDKKTNTLHELSKGKYTFTAINGVENDRFVLKYTNKTLGTDDNEVADKSLIVSVKNKKITLTSSAEAITQVQVFDLLGRKVYDKSKINAQEWSISNLSSSEQTLIVKTTLANGAISNKKIIY